MPMTLVVANYTIRALVIVVGLFIALGVWSSEGFDSHIQQTFGVLMVVFGAYRTVLYHVRRREGSPSD